MKKLTNTIIKILYTSLMCIFYSPLSHAVDAPGSNRAIENATAVASAVQSVEQSIFNKKLPSIVDKLRIFDIPPVYDRPLGIDEGERITVNKIVLSGAVDRPANDLYLHELQRYIEEQRFVALGLDKVVDAGLTNEEWNLLRTLIEKGTTLNTDFDEVAEELTSEFQDILKYLRYNKTFRTGLTVGQLQQLANKITEYYREYGFLLTEARLPEQSVIDGVVTFRVLEGTLGKVVVEGGIGYSSQQLSIQFEDLVGSPITKEGLESRMIFVQELPGINLSAVLSRGISAGESDLIINVQDEENHEFQVYFDNQGVIQTGSVRSRFSYTANNPTSSGDKLNLLFQASGLTSSVNRSTFYGSISYTVPLGTNDAFFDINYGNNTYTFDGDPLDIEGETSYTYIGFRNYWLKTRELQMYSGWTLRNDSSEYRREGSPITDNQRPNLDSIAISFGFTQLSKSTFALNSGEIEYLFGAPGLGLGGVSQKEFGSDRTLAGGVNSTLLPTDFQRLAIRLTRLQSITEEYSILFRYKAQFTNDPLFSIYQRTLGGSDDIRAIPNSYYIRDNYQGGSIEFILNSPGISDVPYDEGLTYGQVMQFSFFYDHSQGYDNSAFDTSPKINLSGYGFGFQFNHPDFIFFKFTIGFPDVNDSERNNSVELDDPLFFTEFRYNF